MNKTVNPIQVTSQTTPYSQPLLPTGQRITYEEFCEIIHSHNNSYQNAPLPPQQPQQQEKKKTINTFTKVLLGLCIVAVIVLIIVVIF